MAAMISQWCAHDGPYQYREYDINERNPDSWTSVDVSQHKVCLQQRWHGYPDPDHVSPDEIESWWCECPCHSKTEETPE